MSNIPIASQLRYNIMIAKKDTEKKLFLLHQRKHKLKSRFVKNTDWPLRLPDCNPLDYYFWDRVQEKVYDGRYCYPFATINELKRRIRDVWDECATDLPQIRKAMKQFLPRLEAVDAKEGGSIKTVFGQTLTNKYIY